MKNNVGYWHCALSQSVSLLILHMNLDLVIDRVRSMLLVLRHWRLPRNYLHLHRARQKELLLLLLLLLVLKVDAVNRTIGGGVVDSIRNIHTIYSNKVVLHLGGMPVVHVH